MTSCSSRRFNFLSLLILACWSGVPIGFSEDAKPKATLPSLPPGILGYWGFGEMQGRSVIDATGRSNLNFSGDGIEWLADGEFRGVRLLNPKSDDNFLVSEPREFLLEAVTVALWIKPNNVENPAGIVNWMSRHGADFYAGFGITIKSGKISWKWVNPLIQKSNSIHTDPNSYPLMNNHWVHIACTWDAETEQSYIFINGSQASDNLEELFANEELDEATTNQKPENLGRASANIKVGQSRINSWEFDGMVTGLVIFDRALDSSEIPDLMDLGKEQK